MSQVTTLKQTPPALIVFGQTDKGHKHAAWFSADESTAANRAAGLRSLAVLEPIPAALTDAVAKIARGRFVVGQISLSKVLPDIYGKILDCAREKNDAAQAGLILPGDKVLTSNEASSEPAKGDGKGDGRGDGVDHQPAPAPVAVDPWQAIKVGDIVLAEYSKEDGWWEGRVVSIDGELIRLSWCDGTGPWREVRGKIGLLPRRA